MKNIRIFSLVIAIIFMVVSKDYTKALQALTLNRTVNDFDKAKAVLDDLMEVNQDYWTLEKRD